MTRSGDANENAMAEGRIYIFNSAGTCVQMLSTDDENTSAQAKLAAGTYTLFSVGGDDLARFTLPSKDEATTSSIIGRQTGKVMDEFLWKQTEVTLEDMLHELRVSTCDASVVMRLSPQVGGP